MAIKVTPRTETIYKRYRGDTDVATVKDGKCVSCETYAQITGQRIDFRRESSFIGSTPEELKVNDFKYSHVNTYYVDDKGNKYVESQDGGWLIEYIDGFDELPHDAVEIVAEVAQ